MAKKKETEPVETTPETPEAVELPYNPATDPNKTAQERLDALHKQHEEMRKHPVGEYPL